MKYYKHWAKFGWLLWVYNIFYPSTVLITLPVTTKTKKTTWHVQNRYIKIINTPKYKYLMVYFLCVVDGMWASWGSWATCSVSCTSGKYSTGSRSRRRSCTNPVPKYDGKQCSGSATELGSCKVYNGCPGKYYYEWFIRIFSSATNALHFR